MDLVPLTNPGIPVFPIYGFEILGGAGRMDVNGCKWLLHTDMSMRIHATTWECLVQKRVKSYIIVYMSYFTYVFNPILPTECNWVPHIEEGTHWSCEFWIMSAAGL